MTSVHSALSNAALRHLRDAIELPDAGARFEVRRLVGQGGMGRVYAAYDRTLEREVAMKVLSLDAETVELTQRLVREARVLARLEHPGIAAIYDAGTLADGRPYYLMRLVRGVSLVDPDPLGSRGERLRLFVRVCDAVAFAHARGVVHRDIKPSNVMLGEFGDVVVLDWGVAKVLLHDDAERNSGVREPVNDALTTSDGVVVGTPGFMAPEQADTSLYRVDTRADVYGLGALLRHVLATGKAGTMTYAATSSVSVSHDMTRLPRPLGAIVAKAMAEDPNQRYQSARALADDVRRWLDAEPVAAYRERPWEVAMRIWERNRTLLMLLGAYVLVRITILVWRGV